MQVKGEHLIFGGAFIGGVSSALFANWMLLDHTYFHPAIIFFLIVVSPFITAMGYAWRRQMHD